MKLKLKKTLIILAVIAAIAAIAAILLSDGGGTVKGAQGPDASSSLSAKEPPSPTAASIPTPSPAPTPTPTPTAPTPAPDVVIEARQDSYTVDGAEKTLAEIAALIEERAGGGAAFFIEDNYASAKAWDELKKLFADHGIAVIER